MNTITRLLALSLVAAAGCHGNDSNESLANRAGSKVGATLTDFASGVGKGVDTKMMVNVELSKTVVDQGLSRTIAKSTGGPGAVPKGISVYLIAARPLKAKLMARALNKEGQEIGRSIVEGEFAAEDAKYIVFNFDREMDTQLVDKYTIDLKK